MTILVVYPTIPRQTRLRDAYPFWNIPVFRHIKDAVTDAVPASAFTASLYSNSGMKLATTATMRVMTEALDSRCKVRPVSFWTDYTVNPSVSHFTFYPEMAVPMGGVHNQGSTFTDSYNHLWTDPYLRAQTHSFFVEVVGSGRLYAAELEVDHIV